MNPEEEFETFEVGATASSYPQKYSRPHRQEVSNVNFVAAKNGKGIEHATWGDDDALPDQQIALIERSGILPGIIEFWEGVLFGNGIGLFQKVWNEQKKKVQVVPLWDEEVFDWVQSSGMIQSILYQLPDYKSTGNAFIQLLFNKNSSQTEKKVKRFAHTDVTDCRLEILKKGRSKHVIVSNRFGDTNREDYSKLDESEESIELYHAEMDEPPSDGRMMWHIKRKKPGRKYYGLPVWYSEETKLNLDFTYEVFVFRKSDIKNSLAPKYKIGVWKKYFEQLYPKPEFNEEQRKEKKEELVNSVHDRLAKPENAGKAVWYDFIYDERTGAVRAAVVIEKIEPNLHEAAYAKALEQNTAFLAMATNTNPGLADLIIQGKLGSDTGAAVRESYNVLEHTKTKIDRLLNLEPYNWALRYNFPELKNAFFEFKSFELTTTDNNKSGVQEKEPTTQEPDVSEEEENEEEEKENKNDN